MTTAALLWMVSVQLLFTGMTGYFLWRALSAKKDKP